MNTHSPMCAVLSHIHSHTYTSMRCENHVKSRYVRIDCMCLRLTYWKWHWNTCVHAPMYTYFHWFKHVCKCEFVCVVRILEIYARNYLYLRQICFANDNERASISLFISLLFFLFLSLLS